MAVDLGKAVAYLELDTSRFTSGFSSVLNDIKTLGSSTADAGEKLNALGGMFKTTGMGLTKYVTLPLAGVGTASVVAASKWESAWTGVTKTVDGTVEQMEALEQGLFDISRRTASSAEDIAAVTEAAGQLGIEIGGPTADNILKFTETMIQLGDTTNLTAEEAAVALARFANITGMEQENFDRLGSTIVELGNNFATTEAEIVDMSLNLAGAGHQIGLSEAQIAGMATALSSLGIEAQAGGTAFSKVMIQMYSAVETGGDKLEQFANVAGMSVDEFVDLFQNDAAGALVAFIEGLGSAEERGESTIGILEEMGISEVRLRDALLRTSSASELFADAMDTATAAWEDNTALSEEAQKRYETFETKVTQLKSAFFELGVEIGDRIMPIIQDVVEGITDFIRSLAESNPGLLDAVVKFGLFAAAIGPVLAIVGNLITLFLGLKTVIGIIAPIIGGLGLPFLGIVAAVGAVIAIVVALIKHFDEVKQAVLNFIEWVPGQLAEIGEAFVNFFTKTIPEAFSQLVENAAESIGSVIETVSQIGQFIGDAFYGVLEIVAEFVYNVIEHVREIPGKIVGFLGEVAEAFSTWASGLIEWAATGVSSIVETIVSFFSELPGKILTFLSNVLSDITQWGSNMITKAVETGTEFLNGIMEFFTELPGDIQEKIDEIFESITQWGSDIVQKAVETGTNFLSSIVSFFSQLPGTIAGFVASALSNIATWGSNMISKAIEVGSNFLSNIIQFFSQLPGKVWEFVSQIPGKVSQVGGMLYSAGAQIFQELFNGIMSVGESILEWVSNLASNISSFIGGIISQFTGMASTAESASSRVQTAASKASGAALSINGSHADGLSYVPFDGYIAELHQGERVLTKDENAQYSSGGSGNGGDTFIFYNTQPDPYEYARQMKKAKEELIYDL